MWFAPLVETDLGIAGAGFKKVGVFGDGFEVEFFERFGVGGYGPGEHEQGLIFFKRVDLIFEAGFVDGFNRAPEVEEDCGVNLAWVGFLFQPVNLSVGWFINLLTNAGVGFEVGVLVMA